MTRSRLVAHFSVRIAPCAQPSRREDSAKPPRAGQCLRLDPLPDVGFQSAEHVLVPLDGRGQERCKTLGREMVEDHALGNANLLGRTSHGVGVECQVERDLLRCAGDSAQDSVEGDGTRIVELMRSTSSDCGHTTAPVLPSVLTASVTRLESAMLCVLRAMHVVSRGCGGPYVATSQVRAGVS